MKTKHLILMAFMALVSCSKETIEPSHLAKTILVIDSPPTNVIEVYCATINGDRLRVNAHGCENFNLLWNGMWIQTQPQKIQLSASGDPACGASIEEFDLTGVQNYQADSIIILIDGLDPITYVY